MIRIIAVGKLKEKYFAYAIDEYVKRLSAYTKLEIIQVPDEKAGENLSEKALEQIREKEAEAIHKNIRSKDKVICLEIKGKKLDSEGFAGLIKKFENSSEPDMTFVIGGSTGLASSVIKRADVHLSFSDMTFPHQLMRVILIEQIYRAYKINRNEPYHK